MHDEGEENDEELGSGKSAAPSYASKKCARSHPDDRMIPLVVFAYRSGSSVEFCTGGFDFISTGAEDFKNRLYSPPLLSSPGRETRNDTNSNLIHADQQLSTHSPSSAMCVG